MKKLTLLLLLFTLSMQAKFYKATVTYNDGTTKNGFTEIPYYRSAVKFRASEKSDTEKIEGDLIKTVHVYFDDNSDQTYFYLFPAQGGSKEPKKQKKKQWFASTYLGKVYFLYFDVDGNIATSMPGRNYFVHIPGNDYALWFMVELAGNQHMVGKKKLFRKMIEANFTEICPALVEKSKSEKFEITEMPELIKIYKQTCE